MRILIDKALKNFSMLYVILCKHEHKSLSLTLKEKQHFKLVYSIQFVEIPTNKGANSYKLNISKIWNIIRK